ncbi:MAG TPA: HEAT repeat domain-containing protein [Tepidisphaeraceae bacterium]|jgi:hypothetical protein|nr:HEAT repeat domain-containing protein [Tepidisphaeraceae bacterium]
MRELFRNTIERLTQILAKEDIETCEREVVGEMNKLPATPFHVALELLIGNDPVDAAGYFDRFFELEAKRFSIGAAYTEMNGFDINPRRWFFDAFAYSADGGFDDQSWFAEWESNRFAEYTIVGLEPLQRMYASPAFRDNANSDACDLAGLLVVVKFQRLIQRAVPHMKLLQFPLYVTAHEYDFIACLDPRPESARTPIRKKSAEQVLNDAIGKLEDDDPNVRFRAVTKLYSLGPAAKASVPSLIARLDDPAPANRSLSASVLAKVEPGSKRVAAALVAQCEREQHQSVQIEIVRALSEYPGGETAKILAGALTSRDSSMRRWAVIALKLLGSGAKEAAPALEKLLETESDQDIKGQATIALKKMRQP